MNFTQESVSVVLAIVYIAADLDTVHISNIEHTIFVY
jgi:hypothetical protein